MPTGTRRRMAKFQAETSAQNTTSATEGDSHADASQCDVAAAVASSTAGDWHTSPRCSARKRPSAGRPPTTAASGRKSRKGSRAAASTTETDVLSTEHTGRNIKTIPDRPRTSESDMEAVKDEAEGETPTSEAPLSKNQEPQLPESLTLPHQQTCNIDLEQMTASDTCSQSVTGQQNSASDTCLQSDTGQQNTSSHSCQESNSTETGQRSGTSSTCQMSVTSDTGQPNTSGVICQQSISSGTCQQRLTGSMGQEATVTTVVAPSLMNELPAQLQACASLVKSETGLTTPEATNDDLPHEASIAQVSKHCSSLSHPVTPAAVRNVQLPGNLVHDPVPKILSIEPTAQLQYSSTEAQPDLYSSNCITVFVVDSNSEPVQSDSPPGGWNICLNQQGAPQPGDVAVLAVPGEVQQVAGASSQVQSPDERGRDAAAEKEAGCTSPDWQHSSNPKCIKNSYTTDKSGLICCSHCSYTTKKMTNFYKHRRLHSGTVRHYQCDFCGHKSTTSSNLSRHMLTHTQERKFECTECKQKFLQKIHLTRHIQYKHVEKSVYCKLCDYTCAKAEPDLRLHRKRCHQKLQETKEVLCDDCGFVAQSKRDLKQHRKFHQPGPELKLFCKECSFVTDCQSKLKRHVMMHTSEKPFACEHCKYRSSQKEHVLRHMQAKHKSSLETSVKAKSKAAGDVAAPANVMDGTTLKTEGQVLLSNSLNRLKKAYKPVDFTKKEKIHACKFCTMTFSKALNLYKHMNLQHKELQKDRELNCVVCDFTASSRQNLILHLRRHTQSTKSNTTGGSCFKKMKLYNCVICNYQSRHHQQVLMHMSSAHNMQGLTKPDGQVSFVVVDTSGIGDAGEVTTALISSTSDFFEDTEAGTSSSVGLQSGGESQSQVLRYSSFTCTDNPTPEIPSDSEVTQTTVLQDELSELESGDYIEINGQMYKVEVANNEEVSEDTEIVQSEVVAAGVEAAGRQLEL